MVRFCNSVKSDQDIDPDKSKLPVVPFQGFGFIILPGESFMGCRFGDDYSLRKNLRRKAERQVQVLVKCGLLWNVGWWLRKGGGGGNRLKRLHWIKTEMPL